ncbi:hypothetical protein [Chromatium okenii]|uniref:hypothetical protein n=1 Tax=Chromatium okenii TaxID=61644 RepID=UPI001558BFB9|nr:hypothetical protein [Chromatium okenii]
MRSPIAHQSWIILQGINHNFHDLRQAQRQIDKMPRLTRLIVIRKLALSVN